MTMQQVSKGEFDRRVKLLEQKVNESANKLMSDYKEFVERINSVVSENPDFNKYAAIVDRINSCFDTNGQFDGSHIAPLSIETSALSVGQRSQALNLKNVKFEVKEYTRDTNNYGVLSVTDENGGTSGNGTLTHYTLFNDVNGNAVGDAIFNVSYSDISIYVQGDSDNEKLHYIYAKLECTKASDGTYIYDNSGGNPTATIIVDKNQRQIEGNKLGENPPTIFGGYLWILLGTISKEFSGTRDGVNYIYRIVDLNYGLTTINGRLITTGRIEGTTGTNPPYIDLDAGEIGGTFKLFTASTTNIDGESYVRSGMSGITDYPSLWAGGKLRHAEILANFRDEWYAAGGSSSYVYPATDYYPVTIPTEDTTLYPYKIHVYPYTNVNGYRHYTSYTKLTFTESLKDADTTRPAGTNGFQVPKAFIDYNGNAKFGKMYLDQQGGFFLGNIQLTTNGAWLNSLTSFIGTASIGDSTHHIYWNGSTFVQAPSSFLPLSGGTMTGNLKLKANQYNREGALDCQNSDIINVNSILTADNAENFGEGLCFYRSASTWDCMSASNGTFYFGSNKAYSAAFVGDAAINCGSININGDAFIGNTSSASHTLSLQSSACQLRMFAYSDGNCYIEAGNSAFNGNSTSGIFYLTGYNATDLNSIELRATTTHCSNNFYATGGVTALQTSSSDKRLKKNIKPFDAKSIIDKLKPVEFEWNKKANKYNSNLELNKKNYGLIAQDSDGIMDNLVFDLPDGKGYKGVRYEKLIPILLQAIKEQQKEIDELKRKIK